MAMKLCKQGHFSEHGAQNKCLECARFRAKKFRLENPERARNVRLAYYAANRGVRCEQSKGYHASKPELAMFRHARKRALKGRYPFTITIDDISIPEFCPLLGVKLQVSTGGVKPYSPSLDKIKPELGYVPGNVWVISHRANQIKSDASVDELMLLTDNLKRRTSTDVQQALTIPWALELPATQTRMPWQ